MARVGALKNVQVELSSSGQQLLANPRVKVAYLGL
jgi:hypothetical protein